MSLLLDDTKDTQDHGAAVATPDQGAPAQAAPRTCRACQAEMAPGQDWCLACGTAAPGRLGSRPGWRSVNAIAAVTLLLLIGAGIAGYAALSGDASNQAGKPAPVSATPVPGQVADVPPSAPTPTPPVTGTPATPVPGTTPPSTGTLPVVPPTPTFTPPTSVTPPVPVTPITPVTPVTPVTPSTGTGSGSTGGGSTGSGSTGGGTTSSGTKTPAVTFTPIDLGADAMSLYDPSKRASAPGDPADAYDGKANTAWSVTAPSDGYPMQVGLLVDLDSTKAVKELELHTKTPGGRVEVYGAVGSALPPDILDTRWEHVTSRSKVDTGTTPGNVKGDGVEKIHLPVGSRFRYVLLWFTTPPTAGPTMKVSELQLLG